MIAFIWQNDLSTLACKLVSKLVSAGYELSVFVRSGQQQDLVTSHLLSSSGDHALPQGVLPQGVSLAVSQAAAVEHAEAVITLLSTPQEVEDVYLGSGGVLAHVASSSLLIDLSTSTPQFAKELHALASVHDHSFVEAPVEGNYDMYETGEFRLYAAGEPDSIVKALPILQALSADVLEVGLPGSGSALKLASQIALAGTIMGVVEMISFALVCGVSNDQILKTLSSNCAASSAAVAFGKKILDEEFYYGAELQQFFFDLAAALDVADENNLALPGLETAHQLYDLLVLAGGSKRGIHALALIYYDEERCAKHGLNWELAQQAMDVYERASDGAYYDYDYDDDDDYECDDTGCRYHLRYRPDGEPPAMGKFFSSN